MNPQMMAAVPTQNTRMPVSQIPGIGKKDALHLWSTYRFFTGSPVGQYNVFTVTQNSSGQGYASPAVLTARETSIITQGQVPLDQRWECLDIGVEILPGAGGLGVPVDQAVEAYNKIQLAFIRGQTQLIQLGPIALFPGGSGLSGVVALEADDQAAPFLVNNQSVGNGFPSVGARRQLRGRTIVLNPGDTWYMAFLVANADGAALNFGTTGDTPNSLDIRVSMWMLRDLGVTG